ncbi:hypothetical protein EXH44_00030 [Actinobacillus indolicus]|uniref:Uncharacterized protein n=1 Tax=Actinobacillus indolicus TaxID=51049 RepID=A0A4P7CD36_9PAST|nr:hypothetical protein EXH44_00030 [Actinobacillus indolicus]
MQRNLLVQFLGGGGAVMYFRYPTTKVFTRKAGIFLPFLFAIIRAFPNFKDFYVSHYFPSQNP